MKTKPQNQTNSFLSVIEVFDKYILVYYGKLVFVESYCSSESNQYSGGEKVSSKKYNPFEFQQKIQRNCQKSIFAWFKKVSFCRSASQSLANFVAVELHNSF